MSESFARETINQIKEKLGMSEEQQGPEQFAHDTERKLRDRIEQLERERDEEGINHLAWKLEAEATQANLIKAVEALTVVVPTEAQICSACLSYDHSFGLMDGPQRVAMMHEAREWLHAWRKEDRAVLAELEGKE